MGKKKKRIHLQNHQLLTNILITMLIILTISMITMTSWASNAIRKNTINIYQDYMEKGTQIVHENSKMQIARLTSDAYSLCTDTTLQMLKQIYTLNTDSINSFVKLNGYISDRIRDLETAQNTIVSSAVYTYDGLIFYSYRYPLKQNLPNIYEIQMTRDDEQEEPIDSLCSYDVIDNPFFESNDMVVPFIYTVNPYKGEYLFVLIGTDKITSFLRSYFIPLFDDFELLDSNGNIIVDSELGLDYDIINEDNGWLVSSASFEDYGWTLKLAKNTAEMVHNIRMAKIWIILLLSALLPIGYALILIVYKKFRDPFDQLYSLMKKNSDSISYNEFQYDGQNEIGELGSMYNEMIDEIHNLVMDLEDKIEELKEEKKMTKWVQDQKRLAEIKALQAQINPHFLYNALNLIVWMAEDLHAWDIKEMTLCLASYYRTGLSNGSDIIPLKQEIEHARNYLAIQSRRYKQIEYSFSCEEELDEMMVPKLILQPLIENAIYHGIKPKDGIGHILITTAHDGDYIKLTVRNDGQTINRTRMMMLNRNLKQGLINQETGYGIYNVNSRLKLTYGQEYGLTLSTDGNWTIAELLVPYKNNKGNGNEDTSM